jgi:cytochrome P450
MRGHFRDLVETRRRRPEGDLISELVRAEEQGDRLSNEELLSTGVSLLVAGHETNTNLIASAVYLLLRHPNQLAELKRNPAGMPGALEEVLRFESPLQRLGRTVLEDIAIDGHEIGKGQTVLSLLGAANRDPGMFPEADRFDIRRTPNKHLAFGHGSHFCLGAALARIEAPIALEVLFDRFPEIRLAREELEWNSGVMRGLRELPLAIGAKDDANVAASS